MGLGGSGKENVEAIAFLALLLTFSFSFYAFVTRPIACFPGDIGTTKCPVSTPFANLNTDPSPGVFTFGLNGFGTPNTVCTNIGTFGLTLTSKSIVLVWGEYSAETGNGTVTYMTVFVDYDTTPFTVAAGTVAPCTVSATEAFIGSPTLYIPAPNTPVFFTQAFTFNVTLAPGTGYFGMELTANVNVKVSQFGIGASGIYARAMP